MNNAKRMVGDREPQPAQRPQKAVDECTANGCPLPGTIRPENGEPVCGVLFLASNQGWPKPTAVLLDHMVLHDMLSV